MLLNHLSVFVVLSINFSCLTVQFGFVSAAECWRIYSWASANPFVYPRTTVAAATPALADASPSKNQMWIAWKCCLWPTHTRVQYYNLLTTFDGSYFHIPDENIAGLL